jgi:hypothetical protein
MSGSKQPTLWGGSSKVLHRDTGKGAIINPSVMDYSPNHSDPLLFIMSFEYASQGTDSVAKNTGLETTTYVSC